MLRHTVHVSTEAKLTQARYGTNSSPANRLARQKANVVATMSPSRINTSTAASAPRCQAKNNHDQSALAAMRDEQAQRHARGAGRAPHEPGRNRHERVQHRPHGAEHPGGRRPGRLAQLRIERCRIDGGDGPYSHPILSSWTLKIDAPSTSTARSVPADFPSGPLFVPLNRHSRAARPLMSATVWISS